VFHPAPQAAASAGVSSVEPVSSTHVVSTQVATL